MLYLEGFMVDCDDQGELGAITENWLLVLISSVAMKWLFKHLFIDLVDSLKLTVF